MLPVIVRSVAIQQLDEQRCPRCTGFTILEPLYATEGLRIVATTQFRCVMCGWRDDVAQQGKFSERELDRQAQRRLIREEHL